MSFTGESLPATIPELLYSRSSGSHSRLVFLSSNSLNSWSYDQLIGEARNYAFRLLTSGIQQHGVDIVLTSFPDHEHHVVFFWACCLAGIPICPLPALHPDPARQIALFKHLQELFHNPIVVTTAETADIIRNLTTDLKVISAEDLPVSNVRATIFPDWKPDPDDIVCFMLTSGSTGNPKAVTLRHSNLLPAVRGKIAHHGTKSTDPFLNWIAFDHVACLSEVHLHALEVDASQYHIASSEIICEPVKLLRLCSQYKIAYTYSPNFLLAKICEYGSVVKLEQTDLSKMKAFITGGEAVPIRSAMAFTDLMESCGAPRNALRAGFGMSETCAGSIYDTRPIPRDFSTFPSQFVSLGKCCNGISMRVVELSTSLVCAPMKTGSLQVKGPTVFKDYYNNSSATSEAFTSDGWFITGDLAYLDVDDNLYLAGRDKDNLNINGVKYACVNFEHYIEDASIEGIAQSSVLVCAMRTGGADTETYAVFYQHVLVTSESPDGTALDSVVATNSAIKARCIVFCSRAPHAVLAFPPKYFAKTALGKVSRSGLAKSYLAGEFKEFEDSQASGNVAVALDLTHPMQYLVAESISEVFNLEPTALSRNQSLFDLGASSMHLMRLKQLLRERLSIREIPTIELLQRPVLGQLCDYLDQLKTQSPISAAVAYQPLVCLHAAGSKPPLFLVHPGIGEILVFINLARVLADDRPVYALRAKGFEYEDSPFTTLMEMVDCYTTAIERCCQEGPYNIAGYSYGGAIAFEIAKKLELKGKYVSWLGIMNLPPHIQFRMQELIWTEVLLNIVMFLSLIPSAAMDPMRHTLRQAFPDVVVSDTEPRSSRTIIEFVFERCDQKRISELNLDVAAFARWVNVAYQINRTGRGFQPQSCVRSALTTVFCAVPLPSMGTREQYKHNRLSEWKDFGGDRFELVDVDGEHYTMLSEEHVHSFAGKLREALKRSECGPATPLTKVDFDTVPVIDFSLANEDEDTYFQQLKFALEDVGFLVFKNVPGFEAGFQKELFTLAEVLFNKPQDWKDSLGTGNSYSLRGYFRADTIDGSHKAHAEAYRFGAEMPIPGDPSDPTIPFWLRLHQGPNQWPKENDLPLFRERIDTLFKRYHELNIILNRHICKLLEIQESILNEYFPQKVEFNSAIWHYFPVTPEIRQKATNGFAQGMHEHRDPSTFVTCLIQSRPGLQVQNHAGRWIDIPMVEGGVVCNIGMQLMKLTGGRLVATTHRVNTLKIEQDRYTIPYVLSTRLEKAVTTLPQFASVAAKIHVAPNPKILKLMAIEDPLIRSGYARLSLFPGATKRLYLKEFKEAQELGIV